MHGHAARQPHRTAVGGAASGLLGVAGRAAADVATSKLRTGLRSTGTKHRFGYLALTADRGRPRGHQGSARGPQAGRGPGTGARPSISGFDLGSGTSRHLTVSFQDGTAWELEVPALRAKDAERVAAAV